MTNQTKNKSFIIHKDSLSVLNKLTDEQAGKLFKAISTYQENKTLPNDNLISIIFEPFLNQFLRDEEKYKNVVERNKTNIAKRWNKTNTKNTSGKFGIPKDTKNTDSDSKSDSKNKNDINISLLREVKKEQFEKDFEEFWEAYNPVKTKDGRIVDKGSKKLAKVAYEKALKKYTADQIFEGTQEYLLDCYNNNRLTCQASVMLNQERFIMEKYQTLDVK